MATSLVAQGNTTLAGPLVAFVEKGAPGTSGIPPAIPRANFTITADDLHIEVETSIEGDPPTGGFFLPAPAVAPTDLHKATLTGISVGIDYRLAVYPLAERGTTAFEAPAPCGRLDPANSTAQAEPPMAGNRLAIDIPAGSSLLWKSCHGDGKVEATGDFLISIWGWTVEGCGDQGCQEFESGPKPVANGAPNQGVLYRAQELWITAYNARVQIPPIVAGVPHVLYAAPDSCISGDSLDFHAAAAILERASDPVISAGKLTLLGELDACGSTQQILGTLGFDVTGTPTQILVDGQILAWATETSVYPAGRPWGWVAGVLALFLLALVVADHVVPRHFRQSPAAREFDGFLYEDASGYRGRRAHGYYIGAYVMGKREKPSWSLLFAWRAVRLAQGSVDAHLMRARLLAQSGRRRAALKEYEALDGLMPNEESRALNSIHVAESYLEVGAVKDAEKWLKRAHTSSPATLASKLAEPGHQNLAAFASKFFG